MEFRVSLLEKANPQLIVLSWCRGKVEIALVRSMLKVVQYLYTAKDITFLECEDMRYSAVKRIVLFYVRRQKDISYKTQSKRICDTFGREYAKVVSGLFFCCFDFRQGR